MLLPAEKLGKPNTTVLNTPYNFPSDVFTRECNAAAKSRPPHFPRCCKEHTGLLLLLQLLLLPLQQVRAVAAPVRSHFTPLKMMQETPQAAAAAAAAAVAVACFAAGRGCSSAC
jgi:hypothetical protein